MRIFVLVDSYLPSTKSVAKLIDDLAREFAEQGHAVTIATPAESNSSAIEVGEERGLCVCRVRSGKIKGAARLQRGWNEARLSNVMWKRGGEFFKQNPHDLVVFYSPTIFFGPLVSRLKALWDCPAYLILRDIFPQWALDAGILRKGPVYWYFRYRELQQYRSADVIGVQSPANLDYFQEHGLSDRYRLEVLYNWMQNEIDIPRTNYRSRWGLDGKTVVFYGGNIGVLQDVENIARLAESLRGEPDAHVLLVGDGSQVGRLQELISRRGLTNISVKPPLDQNEYLGAVREFDIGLISLNKTLKTQNIPGKLLGYLACGLPVLASINAGNDLKEMLERHAAGLVAINGDDRSFHKHALRLVRERLTRARLGKNGRELLSSTFSVKQTASQILESTLGTSQRVRRAA
jgi:glycosyltransferase involved in cell wall biosynthesis